MRPDKQRYLYHLVEDSNLRFWLNNDQWLEYDAEDLSEFMVKNATAGIVTYPSGEVLWGFGQLRQLPSEVHLMLGPVFRDSTPGYRSKNVRNGKGGASIIHGVSRSQKGDPRFNYSTTIKNDTDQKIRVTKSGFACLTLMDG